MDWNANGYRLPTEAEWEYAAQGGNKRQIPPYIYSGSNTIGNVAWYLTNSSNNTHPVGIKTSNELGLFDMSGNVLEWCWDRYGEYIGVAQTNPNGPTTNSRERILRGGFFMVNENYCRISFRNWFGGLHPDNRDGVIGFRCVKSK